jgi:hypothetical protein
MYPKGQRKLKYFPVVLWRQFGTIYVLSWARLILFHYLKSYFCKMRFILSSLSRLDLSRWCHSFTFSLKRKRIILLLHQPCKCMIQFSTVQLGRSTVMLLILKAIALNEVHAIKGPQMWRFVTYCDVLH